MQTISIHDAKTNLSKYIAAAKRGETIAIGAYGKYEVLLVVDPRYTDTAPDSKNVEVEGPAKPLRQFGTLKGKVWIAPDAFSEELDQEICDSFEANLTPDTSLPSKARGQR